MTELKSETRELTINELDNVHGGFASSEHVGGAVPVPVPVTHPSYRGAGNRYTNQRGN